MSEQAPGSAPAPRSLPDNPSLDWLRKQAKRRLAELREANPAAKLADAQFELARQHGFPSWRALKAHVDSLTVEGRLFEAARTGDTTTLAALLDRHPEKLHARNQPYGWTLLHLAAHGGHLAAVDLLLERGLDVNAREEGDNTYAMHWAAAAGHLEVVRRLADAGGDVVGRGDDHALEVIGWATCWDGPDARHRAVADFLVARGARHHVFSAVALDLADEVRRIVTADPAQLHRRMSRNEDHQLPLHFAVRKNRPEMVSLLLELSADPLAVDGSGHAAAAYATAPDVDRRLMEKVRALTAAELLSAERGHRPARGGAMDLVAALALDDRETAARLLRENPRLTDPGAGVLHLMAKRGDGRAVEWLLDHGADPNGRWWHWDAEVTPLHLAAAQGHAEVVRLLLAAGADPRIRDSKHDGDLADWAEYARVPPAPHWREIVQFLEAHVTDADPSPCPECGAARVDGLGCWEQLGMVISWEGDDPELLAEHFLTVATYNLQHPAQFTDRALAGLRAAFVDRLDRGVPVHEIRARIGRAAAGSTRVLRPEAERRPVPRAWSRTIADVCAPGREGAAARVREWAAAVRREL
jgi:ankyrin repeat protein